ncbi:MAG: SCO family protein [Candidatus Poribacteria bacterium]|nr:SCO family protein [Candidatus Poribacteria bacterium]
MPVLLWGVLVFVIAAIVAANIKSFMHRPSEKSVSESPLSRLSENHQLPDFSLTDQNGGALSLADLEGKVWVADFIFTSCPTICPPMTDELRRLQDEFAAESELRFVSFSVDPERDTPAVLSRYAQSFGADHRRWSFLTGEKSSIYQLAHDGFNLAVGHQGSEILHSTRFVLVDRQGTVRGYYDSRIKANLRHLRRDIKTLLG